MDIDILKRLVSFINNKTLTNKQKLELIDFCLSIIIDKNSKIKEENEYCQCEIPDRESGFTYCNYCHKHVSDKRIESLINNKS
ncbi:hypothetical protein M0Q50_06505 [bacterium]|jgi:aspartate carbamoyltransferase regulatory subunit|nr:hypothetical protein [bacterium]